jgi:hypothetical protein
VRRRAMKRVRLANSPYSIDAYAYYRIVADKLPAWTVELTAYVTVARLSRNL